MSVCSTIAHSLCYWRDSHSSSHMPTAANSSCDLRHSSSHMPYAITIWYDRFDIIHIGYSFVCFCCFVFSRLTCCYSWSFYIIWGNSSSDGFSSCPPVTPNNMVTVLATWPGMPLGSAIMVSSFSVRCWIDGALATSSSARSHIDRHYVIVVILVDISWFLKP